MPVREPGSLSKANGAYLVFDHFLRGWRLIKKKKKKKKKKKCRCSNTQFLRNMFSYESCGLR